MEEILYNIEIHKSEANYLGKIYSDIDGMKEFENKRIDELLRDITLDMQLALEQFTNRTAEFVDSQDDIK